MENRIVQIQEAGKKFETFVTQLKNIPSDNGVSPLFQLSSKSVYVCEDGAYKLFPLGEGYGRYLLYKYAELQGAPIFLPCEVISVFPNVSAVLIKEPLVEVIPRFSEKELKDYMQKKGYSLDIIEKLGLNFYQEHNCGCVPGKDDIFIFDGIWNVYPAIKKNLNKISLQDGQGNILIEEDY